MPSDSEFHTRANGKFRVTRNDGTDLPGGKHESCEYLVLDLTHDPEARNAALYFAGLCTAADRPTLGTTLADHVAGLNMRQPLP